MSRRVAYISRTPLEVSPDRPCPDGVELARCISADSYTPDRFDSAYPFCRYISTKTHLSINALMAAYVAKDYCLIITSGEDLGYRTALILKLRKRNIPLLICFHGHAIGSRKNSLLMHLLKSSRNVHWLCLSTSIAEQIIDHFEIPLSNCHVTGFGVDTDFFSPASTSSGSAIVAAGMSNRDYQTLVLSAAGMDTPIKIAADSEWFPKSLNIKASELPPNIEARSYGNYLNLRKLYADARFVVVPLHDANYACGYAVIAEAMAMGKAVIATRTKAPCDFLIDGKTGFFVTPGDQTELRARMLELIGNPQLAAQMGIAGRSLIAQDHSNERFSQKIELVIDQLSQQCSL